ncbi:amidase [Castellaniella sp.]|uniref:amidase n=1 Tax=Castellaniella sp. TaxID=1955812 RepID=UPI00355E527F
MGNSEAICYMTATALADAIRAGDLSAREVMQAHLARIEQVNPQVNAMVTLHAEQAMQAALAADEAQAQGKALGPLHGLPVAHKDLTLTKGMRTTFGSKIHEHFIPDQSALIVERQQQAGAISVGKTNTPEFGAGSQTFNEVFGATRNPYDLSRTCGGSSGGAAVALATGMVPLADGSDMFGSLRCPASFNNVVGLRPSVGRVPRSLTLDGWDSLAVDGPMARTVQDLALYLSVMAGFDARDPLAIAGTGAQFREPLGRDLKGVRIAWSPTMGGLPIEPQVVQMIEAQRSVFEGLGCIVEEACPDFSDATEAALTLRAYQFQANLGELMDRHPGVLKQTIVSNIEAGRALDITQLARARVLRTRLFRQVHDFMSRYEFMVFPTSQVAPFPIEQEYVTQIGDVKMDSYIDWMRSAYYVTATAHPAISVPCGFTAQGLPVGLQIVGRHQADFALLQIAHAFEQATQFGQQHPPIAG